MDNAAWVQLSADDYNRFWSAFQGRYRFRAGVRSEAWPGIKEPSPSVTLDLSPIFDSEGARFVAGCAALNSFAHYVFTLVFRPDEPLVVLDWQHPGYRFWPHQHVSTRRLDGVDLAPVPVFPDGDYYIFMSEDVATGTFGHPWEQTLCVFGDRLVESLAEPLSAWLPVRRINGAPTGQA